MYKESTDELGGRDCHQPLLVPASVIPPTKRNVVAVKGNQTMIGDGDTVRIAPEVAKNLLGTTERRFCINHPSPDGITFAGKRQSTSVRPCVGSRRQRSDIPVGACASIRPQTFHGILCRALLSVKRTGIAGESNASDPVRVLHQE